MCRKVNPQVEAARAFAVVVVHTGMLSDPLVLGADRQVTWSSCMPVNLQV